MNLLKPLIERYGSKAWRTAWYNNLTPGSYSAKISWHPKGKIKGEIPSAIKDYLLGKGRKQNPKWYDYMADPSNNLWMSFPNPHNVKLHADLRKEAYQRYSRIPTLTDYIIDTGRVDANGIPIVHLNMDKIPIENVQDFAERVARLKGKIQTLEDLANFGGNVGVIKRKKSPEDFHITLDDVFDVQPLLNPNRIAESLPSSIRRILFKEKINPLGSKYAKSYDHTRFGRLFKDLELGTITGGKPFRSITSFKGKILPEELYPLKGNLKGIEGIKAKRRYISNAIDHLTDLRLDGLLEVAELENWSKELWDREVSKIMNEESKKVNDWFNSLSPEEQSSKLFAPESEMDYAKRTGIINSKHWLKKGGILIKKKNRGKFTEWCGGNVTQECIDKAKKSGNKKLIKRAVFAENARKWNKK